jgi:cysteine-rich repeat protein
MNRKYSIFIISVFFFAILSYGLFFFHQSRAAKGDIIGMRIYPNIKHISALRWYQEGPFPKGSPQQMVVDGYQGIRDGRTAYVNAANVDIDDGTFYTNIYVLSFTQSAELATEDIFGRLLSRWRFNTNLDIETGECSEATSTKCLTVADCEGLGYCDNFKSKTIRDTLRMENLADIRLSLEQYAKKEKKYPDLAAGSYYTNRTLSVWPSWQETLGGKLGKSLPVDPINQLAVCTANFDQKTCWDENDKTFAWPIELNAGTIPPNNFTYLYRNSNQGSTYNLCAFSETGLIPTTESCNAVCLPFCFEKNCGPDRCGGTCGTCSTGSTCSTGGVCTANCNSSLGCRASFPDSVETSGYCAGSLKCLECEPGSRYAGSACVSICAGADGCNGHCPAYCTAADDPDCSAAGCCGDSRVKGIEGCDDGNTNIGDGCDSSCMVEAGWSCTGSATSISICTLNCGNGHLDTGEVCDDGDTSGGDGCDSSCMVEAGWSCTGSATSISICTLNCGNGHLDTGEVCDDGDTSGGDGCSSSCTVEGGWTCY